MGIISDTHEDRRSLEATLGGRRGQSRSFCTLDLAKGEARFVELL